MKEYSRNNNYNRHKRHKKRRLRFFQGFINLFLILCCCLTALAIGRFSFDFLFAADRQSSAPLPKIEVTATGFNIDSSTNMQSHADETSLSSDEQSDSDDTTWYLRLVNKWNYIPENYELELIELANRQAVDKRIYPALQEMFDSARRDGVYPIVVSGYRTAEKQQRLLEGKIAEYKAEGYSDTEAIKKAEAWVAIPGTSEHQLGIAVDINSDGIRSTGKEVYEWLEENSYRFGFICRYPPDKTEITGVINEPWHYRYVGIEAAAEIRAKGLCLEEYVGGK